MKRQFSYMICAAAMLLAACAKDDAPHPAPETGAQLAIEVFDGGYAPSAGVRPADLHAVDAPTTRAAEKGYATQFTAGDRCGLYIVHGGTVMAANVKLTASAGPDGAVVWTPDASAGTLWFTPGDRYFLYYPWQAAPQGAPTVGQTVDAADDGAFFAALITAWRPAADQSDYAAGYTASDLMTAEASVGPPAAGSVPLLFSMTHRMALAVVELPGTVYKFTNDGIADYSVSAAAAFSGEAQPCRMADHTSRYLVNPEAPTVPTLEGSYDNGTKEFSIVPSGIAGGSYKTYKVDGGTVTKQHTLQIGDYFLSDGHLLAKDADAATVQEAEVVGIVFQTDPARIGQGEKDALTLKDVATPHGLVMAVKNVAKEVPWSTKRTDTDLPNVSTVAACYEDIDGFSHTHAIWSSQDYTSAPDTYPAFKAVADYTVPAPPRTTGWFLPSIGQLWDLFENLGSVAALGEPDNRASQSEGIYWTNQGDVPAKLNAWMAKVGPDDKHVFSASLYIWSSSEVRDLSAMRWFVRSVGYVDCSTNDKVGNSHEVRPVLAF